MPNTGTFHFARPGDGGIDEAALGYDYDYGYEYDGTAISRLGMFAGVDGVRDGRRGDENLALPRQMRRAHVPVHNKVSYDRLSSDDSDYDSRRHADSNSSSSWTSRVSDDSSAPFAAWRARW